jgi:hypothetical protein
MALTQAQICNVALGRIGIKDKVTLITEQSTEAEQLNLVYDHLLDLALTDCDWAFARVRATLAEESGDATDPWSYWYREPSDMVVPRYLTDEVEVARRIDERFRYQREYVESKARMVIFADLEDAVLVYTTRAIDPARYPAYFADLLAWAIAEEIALPLTNNGRMWERAVRGKEVARQHAISAELEAMEEGEPPESELIATR